MTADEAEPSYPDCPGCGRTLDDLDLDTGVCGVCGALIETPDGEVRDLLTDGGHDPAQRPALPRAHQHLEDAKRLAAHGAHDPAVARLRDAIAAATEVQR